jgi:ferredoxin
VERFAPKAVSEPVLAEAFEVVLAQSELTLTVPPERSILSVVEEAGISVLSSCAEGTCGTCEVPVLDGEPDHRDSVLDEDERAADDCIPTYVSTVSSKLRQDPSIDAVITLDASFAVAVQKQLKQDRSSAKIVTYAFNSDLIPLLQDGKVAFTIDQ